VLNVATLVARVVAETSGFNRGMAETESRMVRAAGTMRTAGRAMTMGLTLPIIGIAAESTKFAISFQAQMERIHTQAGVSQAGVNELSKSVMALAPATAFGPAELARGMYHVASVMTATGGTTAQMMNVLKVAAQGAALGGANLEDTTSALAGTMRVFHTPASGAVKIMGQLNAIVGAGNMRMQDLNNAISTGLLPTASGLGIGLNAVGAALATMTDESVPAQVAATRMRTLLLLMTGETKKNVTTLAQMGINAGELAKKMREPGGMIPALQDLHDHLQKFSKSDQVKMLAEAFGGSRSAGTIIQLLNNLEMVRAKFKQINDTAANFPKDVIAQQATEQFKLKNAWAAIQTVMTQIGGIIAPVVSSIAVSISKLVSGFQSLSPHFQKIIVFGALIVAALGPVIWILGTLATAFAAISAPVLIAVAAIAALAYGLKYLYDHVQGVHDAIKGFTDAIGLTTPEINRGTVGFGHMSGELTRMHQILNAGHSIWAAVGPSVKNAMDVVHNAADTVGKFVLQQWQAMVSGVQAHSKEIMAFVHAAWNDIVGVTKAVWPVIKQVIEIAWSAIKIVVQTAMKVIGNVILTVMDLISGNWSGAWKAIKNATSALLSGIVSLIGLELSKAVPLALSVAYKIGKAIAEGIFKVVVFLAELPTRLMAKVGQAVLSVAGWVLGEAAKIGSNIVSGIMSGITGLPGQLAGSLHSMISSAIHTAGGWLHGSGEFMATKHLVGKPLAEGVIEGFLFGIQVLPSKIANSIRVALENAKKAIQASQSTLGNAWTRLADYAMRAFDGATTAQLDKMATKFNARVKKMITDPLAAAQLKMSQGHEDRLELIGSAQKVLTPTEQKIADMQSGHDEAARQQAIKDAQDQLNADKASGADAKTILADQKSLDQAVYDETIASMQKVATAERIAADAAAKTATENENTQYAKDQAAAQAKYDLMLAAMTKVYNRQVLNYQSERDLQKQHLQDMLSAMGTSLSRHPEMWRKYHAEIMKIFHVEFGPGYKTAGTNLGVGFSEGIRESFGTVEKTLHEFAALVAKYLKLKSPAERGPLSTLNTWWDAFTPTLLSGLDTAGISAVTNGIRPASVVGGSGGSGGGGMDMDALVQALQTARPLIGEYHQHDQTDAASVATTLSRKWIRR
jgi:TP901 family phage tail tape measure protein